MDYHDTLQLYITDCCYHVDFFICYVKDFEYDTDVAQLDQKSFHESHDFHEHSLCLDPMRPR